MKKLLIIITLLLAINLSYANNITGCDHNNLTNTLNCTGNLYGNEINTNASLLIYNATIYGNATTDEDSFIYLNATNITIQNSIIKGNGMNQYNNGNIDIITDGSITITNSTLNYQGGQGISEQCSGNGFLNIKTNLLQITNSLLDGRGIYLKRTNNLASNSCRAGSCTTNIHANNFILNESSILCNGGNGDKANIDSEDGGHGSILINVTNKFWMISKAKSFLNAFGGKGGNE